jgi:predicted metalloendopeptidase
LFIWLFVKEALPFLPKYFQEFKLDFSKVYDGTTIKPPRALFCSTLVNSRMEFAAGNLYISHHFNGSLRIEAEEMTDNLISEFKLILKESDWMDQESKNKALEKVDHMDRKIGYSDDIFNETYLESFYKNVFI